MFWPLNISNFNILDRIKICLFFLNYKKRWTMDKYVQKFEKKMAEFTGYKYSIFCSSGSTANTILAMYVKDKIKSPEKNIVVLPSVTWQTSCSPWMREGFTPYFLDIELNTYGIDLDKLEKFLENNHKNVAAVFPTSLLGFSLDYDKLYKLQEKYSDIIFYIDNCENNFSNQNSNSKFRSHFTSTTSTYFGHEIQSVEGGFIFTNSYDEYLQFLMYRNHGMVRSLTNTTFKESFSIENFKNKNVDSRFDFNVLGNNFRNSDIHAFIGILDTKRADKYLAKREEIFKLFLDNIDKNKYLTPDTSNKLIPFCIPIILKQQNTAKRDWAMKFLESKGIETRPIISGFLGYQTCYVDKMSNENYNNSLHVHNNGFYIGLHTGINNKDLLEIIDYLNNL